MDDLTPHQKQSTTSSTQIFMRCSLCLTFLLLLAIGFSGCRQILLIGYIINGEPKQPAPFMVGTGTDLEKGEHRILVIASSNQANLEDGTAVNLDVLEGLTRQLKRKGILVVKPGKVSMWIDENGGFLDDPADLLDDFETDYIVHIEIEKFSFHEENSPELLRATFSGAITAHKVLKNKKSGEKILREVWDTEFSSVHPQNYPIPIQKMSPEIFQQQSIKRLSDQISRLFYAHPSSDTIE